MTQPPNPPGPEGPFNGPQPQGTPNPQQPFHGQQPQGQGPYAGPQQPQGQHPYADPQQGYAPAGGPEAFPEEPKSGFAKVKGVLGIVVVVALVAVGGYAFWSRFQSDAALEAGNCLVITGTADDADHQQVDCDDSETFSFEVSQVLDGNASCGQEYLEYTINSRSRFGNERTDKVTCLFENFRAGTCYDSTSDVMGYEIVDCPGGIFKVTTVEQSDSATCAEGEEPYTVPEPARTFCIGDPTV